jgi:hypothetical protein
MSKAFLVTGISLIVVFFTGFRVVEIPNKIIEDEAMPKAKKEILNKIAGRWITITNIKARNGQPASKIVGSDIYQWAPGGNFLLHYAYGIRDTINFGAMEIIGYDKASGNFISYSFNPDGSFSRDTLSVNNNMWVWKGKEVRSTGVMSEDGKVLKVKHEITTDGKTYELFMDGILTKGSDF